MAKIIMFGNQKGGVGKSCVTTMTATALSQKPFKFKTCIIDLDNQKSIVKARNFDLQAYEIDTVPFDVYDYDLPDLQTNIGQLDKEYDLIFIDVAGKLDNRQPIETQEITKALMYVDCLFIPFVAGSYTFDSTIDYFRFIKNVQLLRASKPRALQVFGFVNMARQKSKAYISLTNDLNRLKESESLILMGNTLNDYSSFRDSDTIQSLYVVNPNTAAKFNFLLWLNEFFDLIKIQYP